jgi:hypothetical protein
MEQNVYNGMAMIYQECISSLITHKGPYTYDEIKTILSKEWTEKDDEKVQEHQEVQIHKK